MSLFTIHEGDCLQALRAMPDASVDAIVTDPPYGLSFMGKRWDYDVPSVEVWAECLRVLKPGGHLLAFAGTRTQHRMAVRIEDAGFEIRDMIAWTYASGFPKSHNLDNLRGDKICGCAEPYTQNGAKQKTKCDLRSVRGADVSAAINPCAERGEILQQGLQEQSTSTAGRTQLPAAEDGGGQSGMEGRRDASQASGELCAGAVHPCAGVGGSDGPQGRLCDGAPADNGGMVRLPADADGGCAPRGPQPAAQQSQEPGAVAGQSKPQAVGAWPVCGGCGLPVVPRGLGTALKPALEPITVARKPLVGTVAENVLAHGTGAINVDGCRVEGAGPSGLKPYTRSTTPEVYALGMAKEGKPVTYADHPLGRWPANLIHDGSGEPTDLLGDAARFFYCAKASKKDRNEGLEAFDAVMTNFAAGTGLSKNGDGSPRNMNADAKNHHPTVKPTDLMRYLCRLVTPPGGVVLDPFMGSGSTGKAALLEGFRFIGCERSPEYVAIARARIAAALQAIAAEIA